MVNTLIGADAAKLAGLQIDLLQKVRQGHITLGHLEWFTNQSEDTIDSLMARSTHSWRKMGDIICFSVRSDGTTGENWIRRLEDRSFRVGNYAKQVLRSPDFKPTKGILTEVAVLKGLLFEDNDRTTKNIRAEANKRRLQTPNAELACLIREKFTSKEIEAMGLWDIVVMHEPINNLDGLPHLLYADRGHNERWLHAFDCRPDSMWPRYDGFAFAISLANT